MKPEQTPRKAWADIVWRCVLIIGLMVVANGLLKDNTPPPAKSESTELLVFATQGIPVQR